MSFNFDDLPDRAKRAFFAKVKPGSGERTRGTDSQEARRKRQDVHGADERDGHNAKARYPGRADELLEALDVFVRREMEERNPRYARDNAGAADWSFMGDSSLSGGPVIEAGGPSGYGALSLVRGSRDRFTREPVTGRMILDPRPHGSAAFSEEKPEGDLFDRVEYKDLLQRIQGLREGLREFKLDLIDLRETADRVFEMSLSTYRRTGAAGAGAALTPDANITREAIKSLVTTGEAGYSPAANTYPFPWLRGVAGLWAYPAGPGITDPGRTLSEKVAEVLTWAEKTREYEVKRHMDYSDADYRAFSELARATGDTRMRPEPPHLYVRPKETNRNRPLTTEELLNAFVRPVKGRPLLSLDTPFGPYELNQVGPFQVTVPMDWARPAGSLSDYFGRRRQELSDFIRVWR